MTAAAGGPVPLVLLHGLTDSSACWPLVVDRYAGVGGRRVVALDARGHGGVPVPDEPFTVAALAADAAAALRALDLGPAVVLGHSMGGVTAQELALTAPDLVAALVLEDPAWRESAGDAARASDAAGAADDARLLGLDDAGSTGATAGGVPVLDDPGRPEWLAGAVDALAGLTVEQVAARGRIDNPGWSDAEIQGWADAKTRVDPRLVAVPHDWTARRWVEALADVSVPVTLLTVGPGRGVVTEAQAARAAQVLGDRLTHVRVPDAGHNIRRDAPEAFFAALDAELARADAAAA
ncbi:alpha/beta fold hydrolase [Cellulomonas triticagri]|uniref:Alpha/beta hydrolase n=1 Tax=Cellulomonas triticagri TaxID=2483352 RepID=A0A3M2JL08_9CELL|nr:alpha/beta hydrolase [Cellulomonas triticagri]RMI12851.1 alpha/beta hydrolase [Cellulomonas triticagri]